MLLALPLSLSLPLFLYPTLCLSIYPSNTLLSIYLSLSSSRIRKEGGKEYVGIIKEEIWALEICTIFELLETVFLISAAMPDNDTYILEYINA